MKPQTLCVPVLKRQPNLQEVIGMHVGRLATETFGKITDPVFIVIELPQPTGETQA